MSTDYTEITTKGRTLKVPALRLGPRTLMSVGRWLKIASIVDEEWLEDPTRDPGALIDEIRRSTLSADVFSFVQRFNEGVPKYPYFFEWDNAAAAPTTSFAKWWDGLPQESRKNVKRAKRMGVVVREVEFNDDLVHGIMGIYNADPVRQTGFFWHYGKSFDLVKKENSTYLDRSCLLGAYVGDELVGFIKMVHVDGSARLMQIVAKSQHRDKRPMNALVAKAVEVCEQRNLAYLVYGKYVYGNKTQSSLTEFKRRNGFEQLAYPKYFVPLTLKGKLALQLRLHRGLLGILPQPVITALVAARRRVLTYLPSRGTSKPVAAEPTPNAASEESA